MRPLHYKDVTPGSSATTLQPVPPRWSLTLATSRSSTMVAAPCPSAGGGLKGSSVKVAEGQ
ncbi:hypothetical protein E2562_033423 [Oryza meyeriana var. granulata]|uniref:Uncharacterized protein n=1 Tax=Oryza meyeriana var. granulata TaxID=110450 RepID=A0A6G1CWQ5_9ORYZ|nr:hypothetical protein E2562_033423 [Oryza meyeriana var. granulata]